MIFLFIFQLYAVISFTQNNDSKISWEFVFDSEKNTAFWSAKLAPGWHIYSQYLDHNLGPIPTEFSFEDNEAIQDISAVTEPTVQPVFDANFGSELIYHSDTVTFSSSIIYTAPTFLKGNILFMLCNDKGCLPPRIKEFNISIE